jgi:hypothetical protein
MKSGWAGIESAVRAKFAHIYGPGAECRVGKRIESGSSTLTAAVGDDGQVVTLTDEECYRAAQGWGWAPTGQEKRR